MTELERTKKCSKCRAVKPVSQFGRAKYYLTVGAKDGLNVQCKRCRRLDMNQRRAKARELKQVERKLMVKAPRLTVADKVRNAVERGHRTREAIRLFTQLHEDLIADALAQLAFDESTIRIVRIGEEREFHIAA